MGRLQTAPQGRIMFGIQKIEFVVKVQEMELLISGKEFWSDARSPT